VSLGICDYLEREISSCRIKWPNDIYVINDKIAGILIENSIMDDAIVNSVAGIGLNVNQIDFQSDAPNPVSMSMVTGKYYDLDVCMGEIAGTLDKRYHQLMAGDHTRIRRDYISRLYRLNEWFDFRDKISTFRGRILSVRDNGILQIETDNRSLKEYSFKEIEFIL
jgi:BirA family biotin operon repressor/biotin-[acetyl-CoA-carboxylase] ligase